MALSHNPNSNRCLKCGKKKGRASENPFLGPEINSIDGEIFDAIWSPLESSKGGCFITQATPSASATSSQPTPTTTMTLDAITTDREADNQISQIKGKISWLQLARPRVTNDIRRLSITQLLQNFGRRIISPFGTSISPWSHELREWQMLR